MTGKRARKKTLSDQQRLRRAEKKVVRVEVSLNNKNTGDIYIADRLADLPPDVTKSDYLRDALLDKITSERRETDTDKQIAAMRAEIETLNAQNEALINKLANLETLLIELASRETVVQTSTQVTVSSGLNMDRPRPRKTLERGSVVEQGMNVTDEFDSLAATRAFVNSVFNAQPGRRQ
jgi:phage shock protein A